MPSEFALIARYFTHRAAGAVLGVGDDAAVLRPGRGMELVVTTDMLVAGTHFFPDADPAALGHKTLAVNLSDIAAMGARPRWALLALSLPAVKPAWLRAFSRGLMALARAHAVDLVGGDTTRGPLNLCVTAIGEVPRGRALRRDGAAAGDDVWVSGRLGAAALAVAHRMRRVQLAPAELTRCRRALERPRPQIALGMALRGLASAAIDVSDGLISDLGHVCERSRLGADVAWAAIPAAPAAARRRDDPVGREALLGGGDEYQLCFTAPPGRRARIAALGTRLGVPLARIGAMRPGRGVRVLDAGGRAIRIGRGGYDHFA